MTENDNGERVLSEEQLAARDAAVAAKREARLRDDVAMSLGNIARRRHGHEREGEAIAKATRDALVIGARFFTWDELAERVGMSRANVGKILAGADRDDDAEALAAQRVKRHKGDPGGKLPAKAAGKRPGKAPAKKAAKATPRPQEAPNGSAAPTSAGKAAKATSGLVAAVDDL